MKIHSKFSGIRGSVTLYNRAVRFAYMITAEAKRRLKILDHWKNHGLSSTVDAFSVSNLLFDNTTKFNEKLNEYLLFYNTKRVHCAFKNKKAPLEVLTASEYYVKKLPAECRNGWTYSIALHFLSGVI